MSSRDMPMIYRDRGVKRRRNGRTSHPKHKLSSRLQRLWKRLDHPQFMGREYIEDEGPEEIGRGSKSV